jgi:hypothetical protein
MTQQKVLLHEFVPFIPDELKEGTLYVCMGLATVVHKCCCGCGNEVVTPLSPTDWKLIFDGETITLHPSIGNWGFRCQSHYWIRDSRVRWAARWSRQEIAAARARDQFAKERYYDTRDTTTGRAPKDTSGTTESDNVELGLWQNVKNWWQRL